MWSPTDQSACCGGWNSQQGGGGGRRASATSITSVHHQHMHTRPACADSHQPAKQHDLCRSHRLKSLRTCVCNVALRVPEGPHNRVDHQLQLRLQAWRKGVCACNSQLRQQRCHASSGRPRATPAVT